MTERLFLSKDWTPAYNDPKVKMTGVKRIDPDIIKNNTPNYKNITKDQMHEFMSRFDE